MRIAEEEISSFAAKPIPWLLGMLVIALSAVLLATPYYLYALLPGLAIMGLLLLGRYPQSAYFLIVFLIPFGAFRGSESFPFLRIHWLLAAYLLIIIFTRSVMQKSIPKQLSSPVWSWLLIFLVINLISALFSTYPLTSYENLFLLVIAYLFIALTMMFVSSKRSIFETLPAVLAISITISSLLSLMGYLFNISLFAESLGGFKRGTGGSYDPNNLSLMIIFSLPLLAHWLRTSHRVLLKLILLIVLLLDIIAIFITYSRGGIIVLGITLLIFSIMNIKKFKPSYVGFLLMTVSASIIFAYIFIPPSYIKHVKRVAFPSQSQERSLGIRSAQLVVGWEAFKNNPIIGSGPGTFRDIYATSKYAYEFAPGISSIESLRHKAHNVYLEVLTGSGGLGLIVFLIIIYVSLRNLFIAKKSLEDQGKKNSASLIEAYILSCLSLLIYLLIFSDVYHKYFLLFIGLSQAALNLSKEIEGESAD